MSLSDYIKEIKVKNTPEYMEYKITPCSHCKHPETKYCLECGDCGREFKDHKVVKESE